MNPIRLQVEPEFDAYPPNDRTAHLIARIIPPDSVEADRNPATVVFALDISGSMEGHKLASAVACASAFVRALSPRDKVALVTFDSVVEIRVTPTEAHDPSFRNALESLHAHHRTNLSEGIDAALFLADEAGPGSRVIALTDGCPNVGLTEPEQILERIESRRGNTVLSAFGYGDDVNPILLQDLAAMGRGNYAFVEAGEPPVVALGSELGALTSTAASDVVVSIRPGDGTRVRRVVRGRGADRLDGNVAVVKLPDLIAAEPAFVGFCLEWYEGATPEVEVKVSFRTGSSGETQQLCAACRPSIGARKGGFNSGAVRDLIPCRISESMFAIARATPAQVASVLRDAERLEVRADTLATAAGVREDPAVSTALHMLRLACEGLRDNEARVALDAVARGEALGRRRATRGGSSFSREELTITSITQINGYEEILRKLQGGGPHGSGN